MCWIQLNKETGKLKNRKSPGVDKIMKYGDKGLSYYKYEQYMQKNIPNTEKKNKKRHLSF